MAFCGKCGATLSPEAGFCGKCGTPVGAPVQASTGSATGNAPWTPVNPPPQPPAQSPSPSSSPAWSPAASPQPQNAGWNQAPAQIPAPPADPAAQGWSATTAGAPDSNWTPATGVPPAPAAPPPTAAAGPGLTPNVAAALAYSLGIITGILFLALEPYRRDRFVRFHAMQSILYFVAAVAFNIAWSICVGILLHISGFLALALVPVRLLISLGLFCLWLFLMFQAFNGREFSIPILGPIARKQAG
jgi:uncharacterized membrane protein